MTTTHASLVLPVPSVVQAGYALPLRGPVDEPWRALLAGLDALDGVLGPAVLEATRAACHPAGGLHLSVVGDELLVGVLLPLARSVEATEVAAAAALALLDALDLEDGTDLVDGREVCRSCLRGATDHPWVDALELFDEVVAPDGTWTLRTTGMRRAGLVQVAVTGVPEDLLEQAREVLRLVADGLQQLTGGVLADQAFLEVSPMLLVGDAGFALSLEIEPEDRGGPYLLLTPDDGWPAAAAQA